ncbi:MAG: GH3 auxin-responsive promoter family protein [Pseudomonadota bacterium]
MFNATPLLKLYAKRRLAKIEQADPLADQRRTLAELLRRAADTRFGKDHRFAALDGVEAFQERVPLRRFEDFWEGYWKRDFPKVTNASWPGTVPYFAKTSGTTSGTSKYIPVTKGILEGNNRAILDLLCFHLRVKPDSRVLGGRTFMLGGSTALEELAPDILAGDMSGISAREVPGWARRFYYPPLEIAQMSDWEAKMARLAEDSPGRDIRLIGGTSSWLLLFLQSLAEGRPGGLGDCYPNLDLLIYGGVAFAPYRKQYDALLKGLSVDLREVYPASEGFLALADRGVGEGLRLQSAGGLFFEFVPVEELDAERPTRHWLGTAQTGINYAIALSSPAGAFAYLLGDTVRFVSTAPPRILITGRTATSLSAFGEHLIEEEIQRAVSTAAGRQDLTVADFSVGPVFPDAQERRGHHVYVIEFAGRQPSQDEMPGLAAAIDQLLCQDNDDYRDHREGDLQMQAPRIQLAPPGTFFEWMKARGRLGGQNKVPRVMNDPSLLDSLLVAAGGQPQTRERA